MSSSKIESPVTITMSGVVDDAMRATSLEGDGRPAPDGSIAVFSGANHIRNGSVETDLTDWVAV